MERKLHLGGQVAKEGWEVLDALPGDVVDHVMDAGDLSAFENETFSEIYASHIFEHFDFTGEARAAMKEWNRVLKKGGKAYISVPNMDVLCALFLDKKNVPIGDRLKIMKVIYGGHGNEHDYHYAGYDWEMMQAVLRDTGFTKAHKVDYFNMFNDTSQAQYRGVSISLNIIAEK